MIAQTQLNDLNSTRGAGGGNFSKATGYQEGRWFNLFPVWTGNNCTRASFWCLNRVFLTKNQIHFLNGIFFFQDNGIKKKKGMWSGWAINVFHPDCTSVLCSFTRGEPHTSCRAPGRRLFGVWFGGLWKHLGLPFLFPTVVYSWPFFGWLTLSPKLFTGGGNQMHSYVLK